MNTQKCKTFQQKHEPSFSDVYTQNFSIIESSNEYQYEELNSYSPYLIEYHEETKSFTYTDPWIELENENSKQTSNDHESTTVDNSYFVEEIVQVAMVENETTTIPDQNQADNVNNNSETTHMNHEESYEQSENVVENHVEDSEPKPDEVSFQHPTHASHKNSFTMCLTG